MIELSTLQIQSHKLPLPGVDKVVQFLLPNGYIVAVRQTHNKHFVVDGYARFRSEQVRDHIPYVAGARELEAHGLRRFLLGNASEKMVKLVLSRVAELQSSKRRGSTVLAWGDELPLALERAIDWLATRNSESLLGQTVKRVGSARRLVQEEDPNSYERLLELEIASTGNKVRDQKMALADAVALRALRGVKFEYRRRQLGLANVDWRSGSDLTVLMLRVARRETGRHEEIASFIGQDLTRARPTEVEKEGMYLAKGASGIWNSLFYNVEARALHPTEWKKLSAFEALLSRSKTRFPIVLWHGFGVRADYAMKAQVGENIPARGGLLHTSMSSVEALKHSYRPHLLGRIHVPAGSPAMFLEGRLKEQEVVLLPGTLLRVRQHLETNVISGPNETTPCHVVDLDPCFHIKIR